MKLSMRIKLSVFLGLLLASAPAFPSTDEYGDLYLMEERSETKRRWSAQAFYSYELSNPYVDTQGANVGALYRIHNNVQLGLMFARYSSSESKITKKIQERLYTDTITQSVFFPDYSLYILSSFTPLTGRINVFNRGISYLSLNILGGPGLAHYRDKYWTGALYWSIRPEAEITDRIGIFGGVGQQIESPFSELNRVFRLQSELGILVRL